MDHCMSESMTLLNAQLGFLDTHVALIHIPLQAYPLFLQAISQLLLRNGRHDEHGNPALPSRPWNYWHPFVNVSLTPNECSVVCPRQVADDLFAPIIARIDPSLKGMVSISKEDYSVVIIDGEGLEAGQRVLDLTTPLAMAGIPIFFITSYWSDFILVPLKARSKVIKALEGRGFVFEAEANGEAGQMKNPTSPTLMSHHRPGSSTSSLDATPIATTPPPTTLTELQARTFAKLKKAGVAPSVDTRIELVTCAGIKETMASSQANNFTEGKLQLGLLKCLTSHPPPAFFSLTLTDTESASVTLEKSLLPLFYHDGEDLLLGKDGPEQIAITLDLRDLPLESTGIVCGVASQLIDGMKRRIGGEMFDVSYLSTAKAGHVIVYEDELSDVMDSLQEAQQNGF
ncbi:hypothetical protein KC332_g2460 [Hortaea werneckii]|uniref:CASTOR ACT domain-containing protein n=2 Tax=Hortaea werneckii TaxID=91943 RepID=A0A3M7J740_HORWE|nr:hypothetical protein KC358_g2411 [Hortaea werneckii]OTA31353.1 hypothetical protein BTJ68_08356 [Hortaea werneckii EXF-2000]KAI6850642.1 hypothetical protein KC350_g2019 [Hortaea werneckii]KAI6942257.1 hypothetical protein KC341_g2380 [Hortaea werneckii]KAI6947586.1 hypothetical protein KC348_g2437 [Hortaea werneckii]